MSCSASVTLSDRVYDTADISEKTNRPKFFGFLTAEQAVFASKLLEHRGVRFGFFGGFEEAQRVMLGCFPQWCEDVGYPITSITATFRKADRLTHRDILGSLMGLGLKRETVGDILVEEGRAVMFLTRETADYAMKQLTKMGRVGVTLSEGFAEPLPQFGTLEDFSVTVASTRIDCVISAIAGVSRNKAAEMIAADLVTVNSVVIKKQTLNVNTGDIISVRHKGKFTIASLEDRTKKDRIILRYKKYI